MFLHVPVGAQQPLFFYDAPLVLAETASVFGEMLLTRSLLLKESSPEGRRALLCGRIEDAISTAYRQNVLTEFELGVRNLISNVENAYWDLYFAYRDLHAKIVARAGIPMVIANGERKDVLTDLLAGEDIGTIFLPRNAKLASRKRWIAFFQRPVGTIVIDDGAVRAVRDNAKSLLAKGVTATEGRFEKGEVVSIRDKNQVEFARGLAKVSSIELKATSGVVVHRDDLVVL